MPQYAYWPNKSNKPCLMLVALKVRDLQGNACVRLGTGAKIKPSHLKTSLVHTYCGEQHLWMCINMFRMLMDSNAVVCIQLPLSLSALMSILTPTPTRIQFSTANLASSCLRSIIAAEQVACRQKQVKNPPFVWEFGTGVKPNRPKMSLSRV